MNITKKFPTLKRILSLVLALVLAVGSISYVAPSAAAMMTQAQASDYINADGATAQQIVDYIAFWNSIKGGSGQLTATRNGNEVTITGTVTRQLNPTNSSFFALVLQMNSNVTVYFRARITGTATNGSQAGQPVIWANGPGRIVFDSSDTYLENRTGNALMATQCRVDISAGEFRGYSSQSSGGSSPTSWLPSVFFSDDAVVRISGGYFPRMDSYGVPGASLQAAYGAQVMITGGIFRRRNSQDDGNVADAQNPRSISLIDSASASNSPPVILYTPEANFTNGKIILEENDWGVIAEIEGGDTISNNRHNSTAGITNKLFNPGIFPGGTDMTWRRNANDLMDVWVNFTNATGGPVIVPLNRAVTNVTPVNINFTEPAAATTLNFGYPSGTSLEVGLAAAGNTNMTPPGNLTYQWYSNTANSNTGGTAINGATNRIYNIPTGLPIGRYYYYCVVSSPTYTWATPKPTRVSRVDVRPVITLASSQSPDPLKLLASGTITVTYTLSGGSWANTLTGAFGMSNLPTGMSAGTPVRTSDTVVTQTISGTPSSMRNAYTVLTTAQDIPTADVPGAPSFVFSGTATRSLNMVKADGVQMSWVTSGEITENSIVVRSSMPSTSGQTTEYAIGVYADIGNDPDPSTLTWTESPEFTGLTEETRYIIFARAAENDTRLAGPVRYDYANTLSTRTVTVTAHGLDNLRVGQAVSGAYVDYTVSGPGHAWVEEVQPGNLSVNDLPPGLSRDTPIRLSDTVYRIPIVGTPTTVNTNPVTLRQSPNIDARWFVNGLLPSRVVGTITAGAVLGAAGLTFDFPTTTDSLTYGQTVGDLELTFTDNDYGTFAWQDPDHMPDADPDPQSFIVEFTPSAETAQNYDLEDIATTTFVFATVHQAAPKNVTWPSVTLEYGQSLNDVTPEESNDGTFSWDVVSGAARPAVAESGVTKFSLTFIPDDTNYHAVTNDDITVTVTKATRTTLWGEITADVTDTSITARFTPDSPVTAPLEFGIASTSNEADIIDGWKSSGDLTYTFTDLNPDDYYRVFVRAAGDENHEPSDSMISDWIITDTIVLHTVTFESNDGSGTMDPVRDIPAGLWTLPNCTFIRTGHTFAGWRVNDTDDTLPVGANITISSDITLYAQWTPNSYTVRFNPNNGIGTMADQDFVYGQTQALQTNTFSRTDFDFAGWDTAPAGTTSVYTDGQSVSLTTVNGEVLNLYAVWIPVGVDIHEVTFDGNGGTPESQKRPVENNNEVGPLPTNMTWENYEFTGWWTAPTGGTEIDASRIIIANITFYAQWTWAPVQDTYTISFDANGGTETMDTVRDVPAGSYALPANGFTAPSNYTFAGWRVDNAGDTLPVGANITISDNITLYAQWTSVQDTYTISFDANGGTGTMNDVLSVPAGSYALPANGFTAPSNCTFAGWRVDNAGDTLPVGANITISDNITLYAQWTLIIRNVTFNATGGTPVSQSRPVPHGSPLGALPTPNRTGHTFNGWFSGNTIVTASTIVNGNLTLTARWTVNSYTVRFHANGGTGRLANQSFRYGTAQRLRNRTNNSIRRNNHLFRGWATSTANARAGKIAYANNASVYNLTTTNNGTINLYAVWGCITAPKAAATPKARNNARGRIRITHKSVKNATGYILQISTGTAFRSNQRTQKINTGNKPKAWNVTRFRNRAIRTGTTYYVRVIAFRTDSAGRRIKAKPSKTKTVRVTR